MQEFRIFSDILKNTVLSFSQLLCKDFWTEPDFLSKNNMNNEGNVKP